MPARKVYSAAAPGRLPEVSRAKGYTSRYMENRWNAWELALKEAEASIKLDITDYKARVDLYKNMRKVQLDALDEATQALEDYKQGVIDENQLRERNFISAQNAANRVAAGTYSSSSSVTRDEDEDAPVTVFNSARVRSRYESELNPNATAVADQVIAGLEGDDPGAVIQTALAQYESAAMAGTGLSQTDKDLARAKVVEGALAHLGAQGMDSDALRNDLFAGEVPGVTPQQTAQIAGSYVAANQVGGGDDLDDATATAAGAGRVSTTARQTVRRRPAVVKAAEVELDPERLAELEGRIAKLKSNLDALEVPELEQRPIIQTAQDTYIEQFGMDRPSPTLRTRLKEREARPSTADLRPTPRRVDPTDLRTVDPENLRAALEARGFIQPLPAQSLAQTDPTRVAAGPTLTQQNNEELRQAMSAGVTLAKSPQSMLMFKERENLQPVVQLWNQSGDDARASELVGQVRQAYPDAEEAKQAITLLYALQAERRLGTMLLPETDTEPDIEPRITPNQ